MSFSNAIYARYRVVAKSLVYYHGTSSRKADLIKKSGLNKGSYLTTSFDDADYYARTGGEWELQEREEAWEQEHGFAPRSEYDLDEMFKVLYPKGEHPVVIVFELASVPKGKIDSGAEGGIELAEEIPPTYIKEIKKIEF